MHGEAQSTTTYTTQPAAPYAAGTEQQQQHTRAHTTRTHARARAGPLLYHSVVTRDS